MKHRARPRYIVLGLAALAAMTGCAPREWWGEAAPRPQVVEPSAEAGCAGPMRILEGDAGESESTFECWAAKIERVWQDVEGHEPGALSANELRRLARARVLALSGDAELDNRRVQALQELLGFKGKLTASGLRAWIEHVRRHRPLMRELYGRMVLGDGQPITYQDFTHAMSLASLTLRRAQWTLNADRLGELIAPFFSPDNPNLRDAPIPLARVAINLIAAYCPTLQDRRRVNAQELSACLPAIAAHLRPGAAAVEFVLNGFRARTARPSEIALALDRLVPAVRSWFEQPQLGTVDPTLWFTLARSLNIPVDERGALESLSWVRKFERESSAYAIHPQLNVLLYSVAREWLHGVLDGMPHFRDCANGPVEHWLDCRPRDPRALAQVSPAIRQALRVRNVDYVADALPLDGRAFSRIHLFQALARPVIDAFDADGNRFLDVHQTADPDNEVTEAIAAGFKVLKNANFLRNLANRFRGLPLKAETTEEDVAGKHLSVRGLTRLMTLLGDTFTPLEFDELKQYERLRRRLNLPRLGAKAAVEINQLQLGSVLFTIDSLTTIRDSYRDPAILGPGVSDALTPHEVDGLPTLSRREVLARLPEILAHHFPTLHKGCAAWGYDRTCDIVFGTVLEPHADPDTGLPTDALPASDLDLLTLTGLFAESVHHRCDYNRDGKLQRRASKGSHQDDMDCVTITLTSAARRLREANILKTSPLVEFLIDAQNGISLTRGVAGAAAMRGTLDNALLHAVLFPLQRHATLGSVFALAAEFIDKERTRAIDATRGRPEPR